MSLIVETGEGTSGANAYCGLAFARDYLSARNKLTDWDAATLAVRQASLIEATQYIDLTFGPRFKGFREFTALDKYARGFLSLEGNAQNNDTLTLGSQVYTFKVTLTGSADEIHIGATTTETLQNIIYAVNASGGVEGTDWGTGTVANTSASAALSDSGAEVIFTALVSGTDGNEIALTTDDPTNINLDTTTLVGGSEPGTQPLEFPRSYLYDRSGVVVDGIPDKLKMATTEYAIRAISASLLPDPTYDSNGRLVTRETKQVGPIKTETRWTEGGDIVITRKYPFADRMLMEYLSGIGGVYR